MNSDIIKQRKKDKTARKYGFSDDQQFTNYIKDLYEIMAMTPILITKVIGCDKSTVERRCIWLPRLLDYLIFVHGHGCWPPRPNIQGSENVFVNSRPHHRLDDGWSVHCCIGGCHSSVTCTGSSTVFVNSLPAARVGDLVCCTSLIMTRKF